MSIWRRLFRRRRARARARELVSAFDRDWAERTLAVVFEGTGEVAIATAVAKTRGLTRDVRLCVDDGRVLDVPAGLILDLLVHLPVREGVVYAPASVAFSLYVSSPPANDGAYRAASRLLPGTRLALHPRGWTPAGVLAPHLR
jgi:hypothetical protein